MSTNPTRPTVINGPNSVCANQAGLAYAVATEPGVNYNWIVPAGANVVSGQGTGSAIINWGSSSGVLKVGSTNDCGFAQRRNLNVNVTCRLSDDFADAIQLLPNPNNGNSILSFNSEPGNYQVIISDVLGRAILQERSSNNQFKIQMQDYPSGLYLVAVRFEDGSQKVIRMIVE